MQSSLLLFERSELLAVMKIKVMGFWVVMLHFDTVGYCHFGNTGIVHHYMVPQSRRPQLVLVLIIYCRYKSVADWGN